MDQLGTTGTGIIVVMAVLVAEMAKLLIARVTTHRRVNGKPLPPNNPHPHIYGLTQEEHDVLIRLDDLRRSYWDDTKAVGRCMDRLLSGQEDIGKILTRIEGRIARATGSLSPGGGGT